MSEDRRPRYRDERERREKKDGITRRDFLDGAAVSAAGLAAAAAAARADRRGGDGPRGSRRRPPARATTRRPSLRRTTATRTRSSTARSRSTARRHQRVAGPLHQRRPRHQQGRARHRRALRLRDRRRRRERDLGGEVLPGSVWLEQAHPDPRRVARLRRPLAPQRVPHPERRQRRRRRDDAAQRRHGQPRQHRHLEQARARGHPRLLRPARDRLPRLGGCRHRHGHQVAERRRRGIPASFGLYQRLLFPSADYDKTTSSPHATPARSPARSRPPSPAGRPSSTARPTAPRPARRSCASRRPTRTSSPTRRARRSPRRRSATISPRSPTSSTW